MKKLTLTVALLALPALALAGPGYHLDGDGDFDGIIDTMAVNAGVPFTVMMSFGIFATKADPGYLGWYRTVCDENNKAQFVSATYNSPIGWTDTPANVSGNCVTLQSTDFTFVNPIDAASKPVVAQLDYTIAEEGALANFVVVGNQSGWMDTSFQTGMAGLSIGVAAQTQQSTGTEPRSWGAVKSLFR